MIKITFVPELALLQLRRIDSPLIKAATMTRKLNDAPIMIGSPLEMDFSWKDSFFDSRPYGSTILRAMPTPSLSKPLKQASFKTSLL